MKRIVVPTGYMGSGSSAVTALVCEFKEYSGKTGSQEFVFLHCPMGVFSLEDQLLIGNNIYISDEYINLFRNRMKELFDLKFWWPGNYKNFIGPEFMNYVDQFIEGLIDYKMDQFWYMNEKPNSFLMTTKKGVQAIGIRFFGKKSFFTPILSQNGVKFSYPSPEKFYKLASEFINNILNSITNEDYIILDQLLLPHNLYRMKHYFEPGEVKVIVVERDPRDVFLQNKYFYTQAHEQIPYPKDVNQFCDFYQKIRTIEKKVDNADILRIHFEELIYEYDNILNKIYDFLDLKPEDHIKKGEIFNPKISINNTQIFHVKEEYFEESKYIEEHLKEFLYPFPSKRVSKIEDVFVD